jgi:ATP-dependent DNA ligase
MFRYPDKPIHQIARERLDDVPGDYFAQLKMDGWRCVVEVATNGLVFTSRHNKPIPISRELSNEVAAMLRMLPVGTVLDGEWVARRPACRDEALWLFDMMQHGSTGLWQVPAIERVRTLHKYVPSDIIAPGVDREYGEFFDNMIERVDAEGVVLKRCDSRYIGSFKSSALNPAWLKCKWRAGEDGMTEIVGRARCLANHG